MMIRLQEDDVKTRRMLRKERQRRAMESWEAKRMVRGMALELLGRVVDRVEFMVNKREEDDMIFGLEVTEMVESLGIMELFDCMETDDATENYRYTGIVDEEDMEMPDAGQGYDVLDGDDEVFAMEVDHELGAGKLNCLELIEQAPVYGTGPGKNRFSAFTEINFDTVENSRRGNLILAKPSQELFNCIDDGVFEEKTSIPCPPPKTNKQTALQSKKGEDKLRINEIVGQSSKGWLSILITNC